MKRGSLVFLVVLGLVPAPPAFAGRLESQHVLPVGRTILRKKPTPGLRLGQWGIANGTGGVLR